MEDKESINEHIRNALSPILMLIEIVENENQFCSDLNDNEYSYLLKEILKSTKNSVKLLCELGKDSFEDKNIWIEAKEKYLLS